MKTIIRNFMFCINTFQGSYLFECSGISGRFRRFYRDFDTD